jgi:hypothetical protein
LEEGDWMSMDKDELDRFIGSIQFDRWVFGFPTRFTLVSHGDRDHDPLESSFRFPEPLIHSGNYIPRKSVNGWMLRDGDRDKFEGVVVSALGPRTVSRLTGVKVSWLHACWWMLSTKKLLVLFVGELDGPEVPLLAKLLENLANVDAILLPSYGGINPPAHRVSHRDQLKNEVALLAEKERKKGRFVYALPHPVLPDWSERCARRV